MMTATTIEFRRISKTYSNGHAAIRGVDLAASAGEFLVLVGPSGSGKSTLLRLLAGLDQPSSGRIVIGGVDVTESPPQDRDLAMVFQSYALYPHMTVRDNLAYGLKVRRTSRATTDKKVAEVAGVLGIEPLLDRRPAQLSGGERQRVALGRALVREPKAFLLDEPLSNLDPSLRAHARAELRRLHQSLGATIVYVTHDQEEAMTLGTRVAVMRAGAVEQVAPPLELYSRPANTFVAGFIGAPSMNLLEASTLGIVAAPRRRAESLPVSARTTCRSARAARWRRRWNWWNRAGTISSSISGSPSPVLRCSWRSAGTPRRSARSSTRSSRASTCTCLETTDGVWTRR